MKITQLDLGLILIELSRITDERGFFCERFNKTVFRDLGLPTEFAQDNHSHSGPAVLRGLHFQGPPWQSKLVGVTRGRVWDVVVDIRPGSPSFGRYVTIELSDARAELIWIPAGFAHGFCVLGSEPADVSYKVDRPYDPATEGGISWADPELAIPWPIERPLMSRRDRTLPSFATYRFAIAGQARVTGQQRT